MGTQLASIEKQLDTVAYTQGTLEHMVRGILGVREMMDRSLRRAWRPSPQCPTLEHHRNVRALVRDGRDASNAALGFLSRQPVELRNARSRVLYALERVRDAVLLRRHPQRIGLVGRPPNSSSNRPPMPGTRGGRG
jgi:hypothetical protein